MIPVTVKEPAGQDRNVMICKYVTGLAQGAIMVNHALQIHVGRTIVGQQVVGMISGRECSVKMVDV